MRLEGKSHCGRVRIFASALLLVALALTFSAGPAFGLTLGHTYSSEFGSGFGTGNGQWAQTYVGTAGAALAVDESGGYVYSTDTANARVMKFTTAGEFLQAWGYGVSDGTGVLQVCSAPSICQAGIAGAGPGQFESPIAIAVDNSNGPNHGDVYVANAPTGFGSPENSVVKFSSAGGYLGKINDSESPGSWEGFADRGPIAVDAQGFLWVAANDHNYVEGGREAGLVTKFSNEVSNEYLGGSTWDCKCGEIRAMTVNPAGTKVYLTDPNATVASYESDGTARSSHFGPGGFYDHLITDPGNSHLYIASDSTVHEYEPSNKEVAGGTFGPGHVGGAAGIAVDASTKKIYVADGTDATIDVFVPSVIPDVTTEPPTNVGTTTATINAKVAPDPAGGGDITSCSFQYINKEEFDLYSGFGFSADLIFEALGTQVPCSQATPYSSQTPVSADLSGLTMETAYAYRALATNSNGTAKGAVQAVTPHAVYGISTDPATDVSQTEATLHGSFDPKGDRHPLLLRMGDGHLIRQQNRRGTRRGRRLDRRQLPGRIHPRRAPGVQDLPLPTGREQFLGNEPRTGRRLPDQTAAPPDRGWDNPLRAGLDRRDARDGDHARLRRHGLPLRIRHDTEIRTGDGAQRIDRVR